MSLTSGAFVLSSTTPVARILAGGTIVTSCGSSATQLMATPTSTSAAPNGAAFDPSGGTNSLAQTTSFITDTPSAGVAASPTPADADRADTDFDSDSVTQCPSSDVELGHVNRDGKNTVDSGFSQNVQDAAGLKGPIDTGRLALVSHRLFAYRQCSDFEGPSCPCFPTAPLGWQRVPRQITSAARIELRLIARQEMHSSRWTSGMDVPACSIAEATWPYVGRRLKKMRSIGGWGRTSSTAPAVAVAISSPVTKQVTSALHLIGPEKAHASLEIEFNLQFSQ